MANIPLFGLDIAAIVDNAIQSAGGTSTGVLIKINQGGRTAGSLTSGRQLTPGNYPFRGFMDNRDQERMDNSQVSGDGDIVSIFGNSLPPAIIPAQGDQIEIEGQTWRITGIKSRDPAAALYECYVASSNGAEVID